jgi:hypothetical protein
MWSKFNKVATAIFVSFFTLFGIQSSYADYYPSGIQQNVSEQTLRNNGWTLFYEQTYGTVIGNTTTPIRPSGQYVILSGKAVGSSTILLAAAAPTAQVFTETVANTPQLLNGTYWYYSLSTLGAFDENLGSIGFAPTNVINQSSADVQTPTDELRLSWHLDAINGGWRLGSINNWNPSVGAGPDLNVSTDYLKQVWTWNGISVAPAPAPAPVYVRQTSNLTFAQSLYASDTLSDPDGQLRKTVDQIMAKYGSLIK